MELFALTQVERDFIANHFYQLIADRLTLAEALPVTVGRLKYVSNSNDEVRIFIVPPLVSHPLTGVCEVAATWRPQLHRLCPLLVPGW